MAAGEQKVVVTLELTGVDASELWYPNGYGAQPLHNLTVTVAPTASSAVGDAGDASRWARRIGLKTIELVYVKASITMQHMHVGSPCKLASLFPPPPPLVVSTAPFANATPSGRSQQPFPAGLPCGRADCGGGPTCSDTQMGGKYTCAFQKATGKCNQSLTPWHVPLGHCCTTCFDCSAECVAASGEKLQSGGLSMVFRVNGIPVFIKGANWSKLKTANFCTAE